MYHFVHLEKYNTSVSIKAFKKYYFTPLINLVLVHPSNKKQICDYISVDGESLKLLFHNKLELDELNIEKDDYMAILEILSEERKMNKIV